MKLGLRGGLTWAAVVAIGASACAADPGDDPKGDGSGAVTTSSSGGSSGSSGTSSGAGTGDDSSTIGTTPSTDDASDASMPVTSDDGTTPAVEAAPPPPSCTTCPLTVEYYDRPPPMHSVQYDVAISNNGSMPEALSDLTLRYWFTADGATTFDGHEYYAGGTINGNVTWTFTTLNATSTPPATATADRYMEVAFSAAAGSVGAMSSTGDIQLEFNDHAYSATLNETNDYSHTASDTMATCAGQNNAITCQSMTITLYRAGMLVWGVEPGGASAAAGDP